MAPNDDGVVSLYPDGKPPGATVINVKLVYRLEMTVGFRADATEEQIRQFVNDRVSIATSLGGCVTRPTVEIMPVGVVTP